MYTLKNKDGNENVCISINGLNKKHCEIIHGDKKEIEAQLNDDWSIEEVKEETSKVKAGNTAQSFKEVKE